MNRHPLISRAASAYRASATVARTLNKEIEGLATATLIRAMLFAIPVLLYFDFEGTWGALLAEFNAHASPLADKAALYAAYLTHTQSYQWFAVIFYGALAFDALSLMARFIFWRLRWPSAPPSPQS
jgi:hypothetical protein